MDFGKTFDMLHWKTLLEKWTSIGLNVSAATWVKKTPNTFLKEKKKKQPKKLNHTKPNPNKKTTPSPHPKPN